MTKSKTHSMITIYGAEARPYYQASDCYISTSGDIEGYSLTTAEALGQSTQTFAQTHLSVEFMNQKLAFFYENILAGLVRN